MAKLIKKLLIGGALAAGASAFALAPRSFNNKRANYVPTMPNVRYAHRGLHDAGSGLDPQHAEDSAAYVAMARTMAERAGFGSASAETAIAPENSLAAFAAAAEAGYGIELDVQLTADKKVVVLHDPDLLRVAGDPRNVRDLTYDELVRIPLFPGAKPGQSKAELLPLADENPPLVTTPDEAPKGYYQHVPLLEDVLALVNGRVPIIVEFKFRDVRAWDPEDDELMEQASDLLEAYKGPYVVESFSPVAMNWYRNHYPQVCRGQLAENASLGNGPVPWLAGMLALDWLSRPDFVAYDWKDGNNGALRLVRQMGALTVAWTVRSPLELAQAEPYFDRVIFEAFVPEAQTIEVVTEH
ncbi:glycerophosphodiester phosphodiesterase family protein [Bifidobacterium gallicum]|uniref:Glycerophosphodiester phosphodiesterase n=1 Tax=Bifidobacterium gallicum DSM 20093 = LMG 11596 TaxID=561180 RepID=D1NVZ4_9BIFI|nr:glycerophosphodiester phosphodiesterase family protein [Bifidobacterium gallicum]EFA22280.1 glycerophosphodiester phosphodiesterase family protein [Bifidobacterium gallicum DSM 20093 = LMG 11596]KFI60007.1 glycerophosphodiester phosphodiesterase [Bifidobacterium gallicum DSM 20093 = LMG 11596]